MQVYINNLDQNVELTDLDSIGSGTDGVLYINGDYVIKIYRPIHLMTDTKFEDFIKAKKDSLNKGDNPSTSRIIFPDYGVQHFPVTNLTIGKLIGYTEQYHLERKNGLRYLRTDDFIEGIGQIREDVHTFFSRNSIAIMDTNPKNLLVTKSGHIYLIDHDRALTINTREKTDRIIDNNYYHHNDRRIISLVSNALLLQAFNEEEYSDEKMRMFLRLRQEIELKNDSLSAILYELKGYKTLEEYSKDKIKVLKARRLSDTY